MKTVCDVIIIELHLLEADSNTCELTHPLLVR